MTKLRVGVIGAGYFARFHCEAWSRMDEVELVALVSLDPKAAESLADAHDIAGRYDDTAKMLAETKPDIVDVVSPPPTHLGMISQAAAAGAAIQCQKPFCASLEEAREAIAVARKHGATLAVHENSRFQPWHREIKAVIDRGTLGDVYQATFRLRPGDGQGPDAYLARQPYFQKMKQFLVRETAIHQIDLFRYFFGSPSGVFARLRRLNPAIAGEDAGLILFDFPGPTQGLFDGNRLVDHSAEDTRRTMGELLIEGSKASIRLDGDARLWLRRHGSQDEEPITYEWRDRNFGGDCVYATSRAFLDHLLDGAPLENDATEYLENCLIEEAVYRSHDEGRWLSLGRTE